MDTLVADTIHICTWRNIDQIQDRLDMILSLPVDTLRSAYSINPLPREFKLKIPISGSTENPSWTPARPWRKSRLCSPRKKRLTSSRSTSSHNRTPMHRRPIIPFHGNDALRKSEREKDRREGNQSTRCGYTNGSKDPSF